MQSKKFFTKKNVVTGVAALFLTGVIFSVAYATSITGSPWAINITGSGAQINWTTDTASDSQVNYGLASDNLSSYSANRCDGGGMVLTHCVNLMGLSPSTLYYYKVTSCAEGQGCGEASNTFTTTGGGGSVPSAPSNLHLNGTPTTSSIPLSWTDNSSNEDKFNVYRKLTTDSSWPSVFMGQLAGNTTTYTDTSVSPGTTYDYAVEACLSEYGCSERTYLIGVSSAAPTIPAMPSGLSLSGTPTASSISIQWTDVATNEDHYVVERKLTTDSNYSGTVLANPSANAVSYTDNSVSPGTTYDYRVKACLEGSGCSDYAYLIGVSSASGGDTTAPTMPTSLVASSTSSSQIVLTWTASTDNIGVTGYKIYRNETYLFTVTTTNLTETTLAAATTYSYYIKAVDAAGNVSPASATVSATTFSSGGGGDTTAPTTPTGLGAAAMSSSQINLSWTASTDNVGVAGYKIYRNGAYLLTVTSPSYSNIGLTPGTNYSYYVKAIDAAGNESSASNTANATTLTSGTGDSTAPTTPTGLVATKNTSNEVNLSWTASTDNVGVSYYSVHRSQNGVWSYIGQSTNTTYNDYYVTPSTSYYYAVKAYDAAGYYSATSTPLFLNTPAVPAGGTTFPPSPTMPSAYFVPNGSYGSSTNIMWADVSNETSYKVYERLQPGGTWVLAKIRTSLDGLVDAIYTANTVSVQVRAYSFGTYEYKVSACNSYGCSDSPSVSVTMGGTTTTTEWTQIAPSHLRLGGTPSISGIPLAWNDNSTNEDKFNIERQISGGNFVGAFLVQLGANVTSYTDTTAASGVYYDYRVQACRSGGGCTDFAYLSGVSIFGMVSTTTTTGSVPNAPSNVRLIPPSFPTQIAFAWNDNSSNEDKWNIERSVAGKYYWTAMTQITTANVVSYTDTTPLRGTYYDYRVQACRSGYGCSPMAYLYKVSTPETAGTVTTASTTQGSAIVSVIRGTSYCDGSLGKTPFTLSVTPYGAAFFKVIMTLPNPVSTIVAPGTYSLPNGSYRWEAVPYTGYTLSGKTGEDFKLDQYCSGTTGTTTTIVNPEITTVIIEQPPTQTFKPYILLNGDAIVRVPYGGTYDERGARGYLTPDGSAVAPKRLLGGLDTKAPGTYTITYQLLSPTTGALLASLTRAVIVEPMPITNTTETTVQPPPQPILAPSVDMITTVEQYERYCDDPAHALECQSYANQKVVASVTDATAPVIVGISQEAFNNVPVGEVFQEVSLPSTITDATQLNAVCAQAEYVAKCTGFLVDQGVLSKEEAESQVKQVFAKEEEVTKIFAERIGARAFEDTDNDTITNYDEVNIYKTDPNKADTNGDGVKDGEQLLLGQDPTAPKTPPVAVAPSAFPTSTAPVAPVIVVPEKKTAYEDPRFAGNVKKEIFAAPTVKAEPIVPPRGAPEAATKAKITLEGKALPNSFVTIYIFSEPIVVTIKTDAAGAWTYTLDKELPDGTHEVYSAITDAGGRILAKSEPLPFVKEAAAVSVGSPLLLAQNEEPGFFSRASLYALIFIMVGVIGLGVSVMGFIASRRKEGSGGSPPMSA